MSRTTNTRTIAPQAANDRVAKAIAILRDRNTPHRMNHAELQIQQAVEIIRQWEPDHPLLRYHERGNPISKPSK